jgi:MFS transporter, BCD family, chlorophyll transporter
MGLLVVIGLGTMGFGMADVLLEPYGGQVLDMSVATTTRLTAVLALGGLVGFAIASRVLLNGREPVDVAWWGTLVGLPAFAAIIASGRWASRGSSWLGRASRAGRRAVRARHAHGHDAQRPARAGGPRPRRLGRGAGHGAGIAVALGGIIRDLVAALPGAEAFRPETPYLPVFTLEFLLLAAALLAIVVLRRKQARIDQTLSYPHRQVRPDVPAATIEPAPPRRQKERETHDDNRVTAL